MTPPSPYDGDTSPYEWGGMLSLENPALLADRLDLGARLAGLGDADDDELGHRRLAHNDADERGHAGIGAGGVAAVDLAAHHDLPVPRLDRVQRAERRRGRLLHPFAHRRHHRLLLA